MSGLDCQYVDDRLLDYLYDELEPNEAEVFAAHLAGCARCKAELASYQRVRSAARSLPLAEPSEDVSLRLLEAAARAVGVAPSAIAGAGAGVGVRADTSELAPSVPAAARGSVPVADIGVTPIRSRRSRGPVERFVFHPAFAAAASFVVVGLGTAWFYVNRHDDMMGQRAESTVAAVTAPEPTAVAAREPMAVPMAVPDPVPGDVQAGQPPGVAAEKMAQGAATLEIAGAGSGGGGTARAEAKPSAIRAAQATPSPSASAVAQAAAPEAPLASPKMEKSAQSLRSRHAPDDVMDAEIAAPAPMPSAGRVPPGRASEASPPPPAAPHTGVLLRGDQNRVLADSIAEQRAAEPPAHAAKKAALSAADGAGPGADHDKSRRLAEEAAYAPALAVAPARAPAIPSGMPAPAAATIGVPAEGLANANTNETALARFRGALVALRGAHGAANADASTCAAVTRNYAAVEASGYRGVKIEDRWDVARCQERLGRYGEARTTLARLRAEAPERSASIDAALARMDASEHALANRKATAAPAAAAGKKAAPAKPAAPAAAESNE